MVNYFRIAFLGYNAHMMLVLTQQVFYAPVSTILLFFVFIFYQSFIESTTKPYHAMPIFTHCAE